MGAAREKLRVKEKELMRACDALTAERRRMPAYDAEASQEHLEQTTRALAARENSSHARG